jgi:hypothetical protein
LTLISPGPDGRGGDGGQGDKAGSAEEGAVEAESEGLIDGVIGARWQQVVVASKTCDVS